jgi:hypothetical protein
MQEHRWQAYRGGTTQHVRILPEPQREQLQPILESASTQHQNSPLEARLNRCQILPFEANFEIVNRAEVSTSALECDRSKVA